jgi:hypothetical protein
MPPSSTVGVFESNPDDCAHHRARRKGKQAAPPPPLRAFFLSLSSACHSPPPPCPSPRHQVSASSKDETPSFRWWRVSKREQTRRGLAGVAAAALFLLEGANGLCRMRLGVGVTAVRVAFGGCDFPISSPP